MNVCNEPGCPLLTENRRCPQHSRVKEAQRSGRHIYDHAWWKHSAQRRAEEGCCQSCGSDADLTVDHPSDRVLCRHCHGRLEAARRAARKTNTGSRFVHVVGAPATGKTYLRTHLAQALGIASYSIDQERLPLLRPGRYWPDDDNEAWASLRAKVQRQPLSIVETGGTSSKEADWLSGMARWTVLCVATDEQRRERLRSRVRDGYRLAVGQPDYVAALLRREGPAHADMVWRGSNTDEILDGARVFTRTAL